jgi:hypothetical protein
MHGAISVHVQRDGFKIVSSFEGGAKPPTERIIKLEPEEPEPPREEVGACLSPTSNESPHVGSATLEASSHAMQQK